MRTRCLPRGDDAGAVMPSRRRVGSAYAIVLIMAGIVSTVALGGLGLRRASIDRAESTADATRALELARSAVELGLHRVRQLDGGVDPRTVEGVWVNKQALGPGTVSVRAIAPDSSAVVTLNLLGIGVGVDDSGVPPVLTIVGEGLVGQARRRLSVVTESVKFPEYQERAVRMGAERHWPLNEGALNNRASELVRNDRGNYSNSLVSGTLPAHLGGLAPDMQDRSRFVTLPNSGVGTTEGTFALWLRRSGGAPADAVVLQAASTTGSRYVIRFVGGNLTVSHTDSKGKSFTVIGPSLPGLTWHHVVGSYGPEGVLLYVNGAPVGSVLSGSSGLDLLPDFPIHVGAGRDTSSGATHSTIGGAIREVSVFSRALSSSEVMKMYGDGKHQNSGSDWKLVAGSWRPVVD